MDTDTALQYGLRGDIAGFTAAFRAECEAGRIPRGAIEGPYRLGTAILVSRDSFGSGYANPRLPSWFPAQVCLPPEETGNWYRWYDPFIWYQTEGDLSSGGDWCTARRNMAYVGKLWSPHSTSEFHRGSNCYCWDFWAIPLAEAAEAAARLSEFRRTG